MVLVLDEKEIDLVVSFLNSYNPHLYFDENVRKSVLNKISVSDDLKLEDLGYHHKSVRQKPFQLTYENDKGGIAYINKDTITKYKAILNTHIVIKIPSEKVQIKKLSQPMNDKTKEEKTDDK